MDGQCTHPTNGQLQHSIKSNAQTGSLWNSRYRSCCCCCGGGGCCCACCCACCCLVSFSISMRMAFLMPWTKTKRTARAPQIRRHTHVRSHTPFTPTHTGEDTRAHAPDEANQKSYVWNTSPDGKRQYATVRPSFSPLISCSPACRSAVSRAPHKSYPLLPKPRRQIPREICGTP
jgi:hypothetical protein